MYKNFLILVIGFLSFSISQERYLDEVFSSVDITEGVVYANAPDLPFIFLFEWNTFDIDLDMDIYEPAGDDELARPVIIFLHPGSFFSGSNTSGDMVSLATDAAKRGYVGISANYRLGLNIVSTYSGERAVYRGVQDASALIRYLREYHEELRIDPEKIFLWGSSAGGFISLHLAFSDDSERPQSTYGGSSDPDLGCIDCEGNNYSHSSKPTAIVSCWGAIGDLDWIDAEDDVPTILFHGTSDIVVPYDVGLPFTINIALPIVYGSNQISQKLDSVGIINESYIEEGEGHEYWGSLNGTWVSGPNEYYYQIQEDSFEFLYQFLDVDSILEGDLNADNVIDVLDVIQAVNFILNSEYENMADLNQDNILNVLDIILYIELILL
tara:strand:- start:52 stop:1197 length:1146 start_codon:yes stop_codon:yes gene_type:complete